MPLFIYRRLPAGNLGMVALMCFNKNPPSRVFTFSLGLNYTEADRSSPQDNNPCPMRRNSKKQTLGRFTDTMFIINTASIIKSVV